MSISLLANIALMYAILVGVNLPAPILGLEFDDDGDRDRLWFEPPGFVIPLAWFVLFTLLGVARYDLGNRDASDELAWWIVGLALLCATYAYYTLGLSKLTGISALWFGLAGNAVVIAAAFAVAYRLLDASTLASLLVLPVIVWTLYATAIVVGQMRAQELI